MKRGNTMSAEGDRYRSIPEAPPAAGAGAVLGRMADAIGFRYRWSTEGILPADLPFKPAADCMSLGELLSHVLGLLSWVAENLGLPPRPELTESEDPEELRGRTLELAEALSTRFKGMSDTEVAGITITSSRGDILPMWNMVNGPLSDSLTHIGQILSWRRIAGIPAAAADVFRGRPPRKPNEGGHA
jgi:hypothetical protein